MKLAGEVQEKLFGGEDRAAALAVKDHIAIDQGDQPGSQGSLQGSQVPIHRTPSEAMTPAEGGMAITGTCAALSASMTIWFKARASRQTSTKPMPLRRGMHPGAGAVLMGGHVPKGTRAMPKHQAQSGAGAQRRGNFACQAGEQLGTGGMRAGLFR